MATRGRRPGLWWVVVLLPTVALAWLAMQASDAYDAVSDAQVRSLVRRGIARAREIYDEELAVLLQEIDTAHARAAAEAERAIPMAGIPEGMAEARRHVLFVGNTSIGRAGWIGDLRLRDAQGRGLFPREHVPTDAPVDVAVSGLTGMDEVFAELSRQADRAFYGPEGIEGARAVWTAAMARFGSPLNRARCDVERTRLELRGMSGADGARKARTAVEALEARHGVDTLRAVGRPAILLWLVAPRYQRIYDALMDGVLDRVPLTDDERAHAIDMCRHQAPDVRGNHPLDMRVLPGLHHAHTPPLVFPRAIAGGASLDLLIQQHRVWNALFHRVRDRFDVDGITFTVLSAPWRLPDGTIGPPPPGDGTWRAQSTIEGPLGAVGTIGIAFDGWRDLQAERRTRRLLVSLAVAALFLLTLGGIWFMRRAVARERAARRLRDDFIANVTHEVRTPLTSVLMHAEMLADDDLAPDRKRTYARVVHAEGARLATLVEDMLDFSALESGTRTLSLEPVDVVAAARRAVEPFAVLAEREGVSLAVEVPDDETIASADASALSRILANLVGNAWKHGRPSQDGAPGRIRVRVFPSDADVLVELRDDGPGIPGGDRRQIFERFGRGRAAGAKEGAGLGLALSRELARAMGGELSAHAESDETVFRLRLRAGSETVEP